LHITIPESNRVQTSSVLITLALPALALTSAACTTEAWYEGMKYSAESRCRQQPPSEFQACRDRLNKENHATYERQRADLK